ncbi:Tetratricopeptide repeat-containing protein [Bizionia echini]|uniref:Tetratricopeptide repeat-containing protein n=1 Tax=Bizionia echini TaxID=649333 RepID=A0A1I5CYT3_9FLAO|nr:tetratricopeptide repeat protein [Bizionia echini]SFN92160.1 Tetratricopeptide repeat-containing protein [Bizionia echini]
MKKLLLCLLVPVLGMAQQALDDVALLLDKKNYKQAETIIEPYALANPTNKRAVELLGDAYGYQSKWDAAIKQYKLLVALEPNEANFHYKYGGAMGMKALEVNKVSALMLIDDVEDAFLKAAELDSKHINTRWALVELYMQLPGIVGGSVKKSLKYANELEALSKVDGYLAKGYIYEYDDEPELAETYYKRAITTGGSITCFEKLANFYEKQQQPDKAIATIEASEKKHKRNAVHYQIGKVAAEYNLQLEKGENCLKRYLANYSVEDGVPKAWANYRLAQIYKHQNRKKEALKHIDLALAELPEIEVFSAEKSAILNR